MSRLKQLKNNIHYIVGEYYNGMLDDPDEFPEMTQEECITYVKSCIYDMKVIGSSCHYENGICNDLAFLGNKLIEETIIKLAGDIMK